MAACERERLTRERARPDLFVVGPAGKLEGVLPAADPGEEVHAGVSTQIVGSEFSDVSRVDMSSGVEGAEPAGGEGVMLVEEHACTLTVSGNREASARAVHMLGCTETCTRALWPLCRIAELHRSGSVVQKNQLGDAGSVFARNFA